MTVTQTDGMRQTNTIQGGADSSIWPWQKWMECDRRTLFREGLTPAYDRGRDGWNETDEHYSGRGWLQHMTVAETCGTRQMNTVQVVVSSCLWSWHGWNTTKWTLFMEVLAPAYQRGRDCWTLLGRSSIWPWQRRVEYDRWTLFR